MKDIETIWDELEEWRERTAGDVSVESLGAGWLCRLQAPNHGIGPALCHGVDATTAVEGALAVLALRDNASAKKSSPRGFPRRAPRSLDSVNSGRVPSERVPSGRVPSGRVTSERVPPERAPDSRVTTRGVYDERKLRIEVSGSTSIEAPGAIEAFERAGALKGR